MTLDEERKKLIDHLQGWRECTDTKCEDCRFSNPMGVKRECTVMDSKDLIDLALKVVKNDEILLKNQEPVEPRKDFGGHHIWRCGNCGTTMYHTYYDIAMEDAKNFIHFCRKCGRPVKWE